MFDWLMNYSSIIRATIIGLIIVAMIILITSFIYFVKPKIKRENFKYFYAFSAGFIVIVGSLGLFGSARNALKNHFQVTNHPSESDFTTTEIFLVAAYVLLVLSFAGLIIWTIKKMFISDDHGLSSKSKSEKDFKKKKVVGIVMVLLHRVPASFVIGAFADDPVGESAALFAIILHIIPELMIVFYRQIEMGVPKGKAYINSILIKIVFLPLIIIGNLLTTWTTEQWWFLPALYLMGGAFLIYASFIELTPEFSPELSIGHTHEHLEDLSIQLDHGHINHKDVTTIKQKRKVSVMLSLSLMIGVSFAAAIMFFHFH